MGKRVLLVGATGMVGGEALARCLASPAIAQVTVLTRRATGRQHAKLTEVLHRDFCNYNGVEHCFAAQDAALFCIGVYTGSMPDEAFRRITVDVPAAFFGVLGQHSPGAAVCFLSGQGADTKESSRLAFARYKGIAENALLAHGFAHTHIFRPGYIYPTTPRTEPSLSYRLFRGLYPLLRRIYPNIGIASTDLAAAMVHAGLHGTGNHRAPILENRDIRTLAATLKTP